MLHKKFSYIISSLLSHSSSYVIWLHQFHYPFFYPTPLPPFSSPNFPSLVLDSVFTISTTTIILLHTNPCSLLDFVFLISYKKKKLGKCIAESSYKCNSYHYFCVHPSHTHTHGLKITFLPFLHLWYLSFQEFKL